MNLAALNSTHGTTSRTRAGVANALALLAALTLSTNSIATDRLVPSGYPTIQAAINASSHGDRVLLAAGDYVGDGNRDLDFGGRQLTLEPEVAGTECRLLPGIGHRGISFVSGEGPLSRVVGLTIEGSYLESVGGAAVLLENSSPTFIECTFFDCTTTGWGGAVHVEAGDPTFARCRFRNNVSDRGGAVHMETGEVFFLDCEFISNLATSRGGAVDHGVGPTISSYAGCTFRSNSSNTGGALHFSSATHETSIIGCDFAFNAAFALGGALRTNEGFTGEVVNCQFLVNSATSDGRVWFDNGADSISMINCSAALNLPTDSDKNAVLLFRCNTLAVANCIVWNNGGGAVNTNHSGVIDIHHSCIEGGHPGEGNLDVDPRFDPADPERLRLLRGSPCLDQGDNDSIPPLIIFDLDGNLRLIDGDGNGEDVVDMGAFELPAPEGPACPPDFDHDEVVGFSDLLLILFHWGPCDGCPQDIDASGAVDFGDLLIVLGSWGPCL